MYQKIRKPIGVDWWYDYKDMSYKFNSMTMSYEAFQSVHIGTNKYCGRSLYLGGAFSSNWNDIKGFLKAHSKRTIAKAKCGKLIALRDNAKWRNVK